MDGNHPNNQLANHSRGSSTKIFVAFMAIAIAVAFAIAGIAIWLVLKLVSPLGPASQPIVIVATPTNTPTVATMVEDSALTPTYSQIVTEIAPLATDTVTPTLIPGTIITGLPKIKTATPRPPQPITITITNEQATEQAIAIAESEDIVLDDLRVAFTEEHIMLTGYYKTGISSVHVEAIAQPIIVDEQLHVEVVSLKMGDTPLPDSTIKQGVERILNNTFDYLLRGKRVQTYSLTPESLVIFALDDP
jgi:hypothetical protein